jgi:hypothetical protein
MLVICENVIKNTKFVSLHVLEKASKFRVVSIYSLRAVWVCGGVGKL